MRQISPPTLLAAQQGAVLTLTLDRVESLNSLTGELTTLLLQALNRAATQPDVRCVVLTGAGRAFCAGQDLKDPAVAADAGARPDLGGVVERYYKPLALRLQSMPVPTLAAVNGVAAGAGASLALLCDVVVAKRGARFIQAFSAIGLIPDSGATWTLPRLVGRAHALGLTLLGERLSAEDAARIGLIWACIADEAFDDEVRALANKLAALPTRALVRTRELIDQAGSATLEQALDAEARVQRELGHAADYAEGVAAFAHKRTPQFSDR